MVRSRGLRRVADFERTITNEWSYQPTPGEVSVCSLIDLGFCRFSADRATTSAAVVTILNNFNSTDRVTKLTLEPQGRVN